MVLKENKMILEEAIIIANQRLGDNEGVDLFYYLNEDDEEVRKILLDVIKKEI